MKPQIKILLSVSIPLATVVAAVTTWLILRKPNCDECSMLCGVTCESNPRCKGTKCDNPDATCKDGMCVVKHSCSPTGECVPDPSGPFDGKTCTCFSLKNEQCVPIGNEGEFKTKQACEARDSNFACVPGTGTCERTLGSTTGWETESECKCFECGQDMKCVPSQDTQPVDGVDGIGCLECGRWKCDGGECVQSKTGGVWETPENCRCGMCSDGECVASESGGAYTSVSACLEDDARVCKHPNLGWSCNQQAGNEQGCAQSIDGTAATLDDCRCWSCAGKSPGPQSICTFDARNKGKYTTFNKCRLDEEDKCGWKYMCVS